MRRGHAVAFVSALLLLFVMALDWYGTAQGDDLREFQSQTQGVGQLAEENDAAREAAEGQEKNAWQADAVIDRVLLGLLLAAIALAVLTAAARAAGARPTRGVGPAGLTAMLAALAAALVAYRIIQEPGLDAATHVKAGAPLALVPLAGIALGMASALRADEQDREAAS